MLSSAAISPRSAAIRSGNSSSARFWLNDSLRFAAGRSAVSRAGAFSDFGGTLLIVSHDRDFLDRVATSVIAAEGDGRWREYAGGYSDLVAQRGYGLSGAHLAEAPKAEKAPRETADRPAAKRKLSFNQKRALELLPGQIAALRDEIAALEAKLADVDLHGRDPAGFDRATRAYADKRGELERAEDEWLALEILREELEA